MIGTVISGRYTLEAEVGRGGMGAVWRGRDEVLGRTVALKRIGVAPGGLTPDAVRAEREAKLAAKLNHANVVAVFDLVAESTDGQSQQWLVMEYVEGTDLADLIRERGRLTPDEAAPILAQTASALAAAHGAGIVHRDVKPSNILVAPDGQVKLSDFGIARTDADPALTQTGLVTGSPAYLSPEVASGQQATPASDVWSWGATLFHALEGRPPYQVGDNVLGALYRIVHEEPPRPVSAGWLTPVLAATMTREPGQRWPITAAQEFLEAGPRTATAPTPVGRRAHSREDVAGTQVLPVGGVAAPPREADTPPQPPDTLPRGLRRRRSRLLIALAVLALVAATVTAFVIGLGGREDNDPGADPTNSPSGGPSQTADPGPTAEGMEDFVRTYIDTVVRDPETGFEMLTPAFQQASGGLEGYEEFWGEVDSAKVDSVDADPDELTVRYTYTFHRGPGKPETDTVTLELSYSDGTYLIADEL